MRGGVELIKQYGYCSLLGTSTHVLTQHTHTLWCLVRVMLLPFQDEKEFSALYSNYLDQVSLGNQETARLVQIMLYMLPSQIHSEGSLMIGESAGTATVFRGTCSISKSQSGCIGFIFILLSHKGMYKYIFF